MRRPDEIAAALERLYRAIAEGAMAGLPICNPRLGVAARGFRAVGGEAVGLVVTPWFLNVVAAPLLPAAVTPAEAGATRKLALPAGVIDLIIGELAGFGRLDSASLFSPMHDFADMAAALATAESAAEALFAAPALDRRAFLRGARAG
jgi:[NiFe] hydrogenase assembly HybE family chaperone